jgi:hypothetical protein
VRFIQSERHEKEKTNRTTMVLLPSCLLNSFSSENIDFSVMQFQQQHTRIQNQLLVAQHEKGIFIWGSLANLLLQHKLDDEHAHMQKQEPDSKNNWSKFY